VDAINDRSTGHRTHELPDPSFPGTAQPGCSTTAMIPRAHPKHVATRTS
jgi:hypothetical protein